jgi:hypothetical protein
VYIQIVARRGKNQYSWKGFGEIPRSLDELKEEGMRERLGYSSSNNSDKVSNGCEREEPLTLTPDDQENSSSSKMGNLLSSSVLFCWSVINIHLLITIGISVHNLILNKHSSANSSALTKCYLMNKSFQDKIFFRS